METIAMAQETDRGEQVRSALKASLWVTAYNNYILSMNDSVPLLEMCVKSVNKFAAAFDPLLQTLSNLPPEGRKATLDSLKGVIRTILLISLDGYTHMLGRLMGFLIESLSEEVKALNALGVPTPDEVKTLANMKIEVASLMSKASELSARVITSTDLTHEIKDVTGFSIRMGVLLNGESALRGRLKAKAYQVKEIVPAMLQGMSADELSRLTFGILLPQPESRSSPANQGTV